LTLALDDTPTERYGPHVQGAGVHHNPTPGPAGSPYVYGHVFIVLGLLAAHGARGTIALPLLPRLYVRKVDHPGIDPKHRPEFRTKLELAVELLRRAMKLLALLKLPIWVADGGVRQGRLPQASDRAGDDGGQSAPQGRGVTDGARRPMGASDRPHPGEPNGTTLVIRTAAPLICNPLHCPGPTLSGPARRDERCHRTDRRGGPGAPHRQVSPSVPPSQRHR
jgi:hypothetical protein